MRIVTLAMLLCITGVTLGQRLVDEANPHPGLPTVYDMDQGGLQGLMPHFTSNGAGKATLPSWWDQPIPGLEETGSLSHAQQYFHPDVTAGVTQFIPGPSVQRAPGDILWDYCTPGSRCIYGMYGGIYKNATSAHPSGDGRWYHGDPMWLEVPAPTDGPDTLRFAGWIDVVAYPRHQQDTDYRLHVFPMARLKYYRIYQCGSLGGYNLEGVEISPSNAWRADGTELEFEWLASERAGNYTQRWYFEGKVTLDPDTSWLTCDDTPFAGTCSCVGIWQAPGYEPEMFRWGVEWCGEFRQCCTASPLGNIYHTVRFWRESDQVPFDVNLDGHVDGLDIAAIKAPGTWMLPSRTAANTRADVNDDGQVNGLDIAAVKSAMN